MSQLVISIAILVIAAIAIVYCLRKMSQQKKDLLELSQNLSQAQDNLSQTQDNLTQAQAEKISLESELKQQKEIFAAKEQQREQIDKERAENQAKLDAQRDAAQAKMEAKTAELLETMQREREDYLAKLKQERDDNLAKLQKERDDSLAKLAKVQQESVDKLENERKESVAKLEKEREEARKQIEIERKNAFDSLSKQMEESFKNLSSQNSQELRQRNNESISELLKPLAEKFEQYDKSVKEGQEKADKQDTLLNKAIQDMLERTNSVGNEAKNLANALTGKSKVQGDFGEMLLIDLLKASGLEEGTHFRAQSVLRDEFGHEIKSDGGSTMIPDVIVDYPDDSEVVIDSKVSLTAYTNYSNATTLEERNRWAKEHCRSITRHIEELRTKDYASYISEGKKKTDYNIMFIPIEGAFRLMLEEEPLLWNEAKKDKVLIVSQMNLAIVLNTILLGWRRYDQQKNLQEVYQTAQELMGQLKSWMEYFVKVGDCLQKADSAYNDARKKLKDSNQSVFNKIAKLERYNLSPKRSTGKIKTSSRSTTGFESIIPSALLDGNEEGNLLAE